jgi:prevent-host-death family protein
MSLIGVRELREQTSEVIRRVREEQAEYVITYNGRPVAVILPLDVERAEAAMVEAGRQAVLDNWDRYERVAAQVRQAWPADRSTQDVIDAIRR